MWLLNTTTLKLEYFVGKVPEYAILSHRWYEHEELTFGDVTEASNSLSGYHKVRRFCEIAKANGFDYGWVDTCCIDKKSSAELSEAINSMYRWYRDSAVCYAYLADVNTVEEVDKSSWFTRGWTLQELLAPSELIFFNGHWSRLATRKDLSPLIEARTGIPETALTKFYSPDYCIALKMSWAAERITTREEDRAYSLLGLFDVHMPLLYGEGSMAFWRLQEEIMRSSTDTSIFMWSAHACDGFGMLANNPWSFSNIPSGLKNLTESRILRSISLVEGWSSGNAGIRLSGELRPYALSTDGIELFILEMCFTGSTGNMGVLLVRSEGRTNVPHYIRTAVNGQTWAAIPLVQRQATLVQHRLGPADILMMRQPLMEHQITSPSTLTIRVAVAESFDIIAQQRPGYGTNKLLAQWPQVPNEDFDNSSFLPISYQFTTQPGFIEGISALLVLKEQTTGQPLCIIGVGFDDDFNTIFIVVPAENIYEDSTERHLLEAYYSILRSKFAESEIRSARSIANGDSTSRLFALRLGREGTELVISDPGHIVEVSRGGGRKAREYRIRIDGGRNNRSVGPGKSRHEADRTASQVKAHIPLKPYGSWRP